MKLLIAIVTLLLLATPSLAADQFFSPEGERSIRADGYIDASIDKVWEAWPDWPIAPFVHIGGGGMHEDPNDEFVRSAADFYHARAGGGFLISLRWRILLRAEANNTILFTEDSYTNVQTYYGGLGTYF